MREWAGKRYWLVGASEGLGRAVAERMSRMGVHLFLSARSEDRLADLAANLPGQSTLVPVDVTDPSSVASASERIGEIDGFIYLAGAYWPMSAKRWKPDKAEQMIDINLTGAVRCLSAVVPAMVERNAGHIVLTGSLSAYRGLPGTVGYSASKAGIASLADTLYADLRDTDIDVQVIHPGFIRTRLTDQNDFSMPQIMEPERAAEEFVDHMNSDGFQKAYPAPFSWLFRLAPIMPNWLYLAIFRSN